MKARTLLLLNPIIMTPYERWQLEKYGNVLPAKKSVFYAEDEEYEHEPEQETETKNPEIKWQESQASNSL